MYITAVQREKAASAFSTSKHILYFAFAARYSQHQCSNIGVKEITPCCVNVFR